MIFTVDGTADFVVEAGESVEENVFDATVDFTGVGRGEDAFDLAAESERLMSEAHAAASPSKPSTSEPYRAINEASALL